MTLPDEIWSEFWEGLMSEKKQSVQNQQYLGMQDK